MSWLLCLLCGLFLLDALRARAKFRSLAVLPGSGEKPKADYICFAAPGLVVRDDTIAAAAEYAESRNIELLDLVPGDAPALELIRMFYRIHPGSYGTNRIALGHTTGYCLVVSRKLVSRCGVEKQAVTETADLYRLARLFKKYAIDKAGIAVATNLNAAPAGNGTQRWPVLSEFMRPGARAFFVFQGCLLLTLLSSVLVSVRTGLIIIAAYHLQVLLVFSGQKIRPRDLVRTALFRIVLDVWNLCMLAVTRLAYSGPDGLKVGELRSAYASELADGIERFFETRRADCPVCAARELRIWIQTTDLFQFKPGQFTLDRCCTCGHIFQNPRLSLAGLEFYYRDHYNGLGAAEMEWAYQGQIAEGTYLRRAEVVRRLAQPARWLDVGTAYGHFCCYARNIFPKTEFDGLDMSCSIDEAARTGWVNRGFRGLLPEIAPRLTGQYDVVSMFHYLEHVLEPAEEIRSAHTVLAPDGLIVVEVPNPECWFGRVFGRYWLAWYQPQHLNMFSSTNLSRLLRQNGFEPVLLEGTYVQQQFDIFLATMVFLNWLAPKTGLPWQPRATAFLRLRRVMWVFGVPVLLLAGLADMAFRPIARRWKTANSYRMLGRRVDISDPTIATRLRAESRELQFQ